MSHYYAAGKAVLSLAFTPVCRAPFCRFRLRARRNSSCAIERLVRNRLSDAAGAITCSVQWRLKVIFTSSLKTSEPSAATIHPVFGFARLAGRHRQPSRAGASASGCGCLAGEINMTGAASDALRRCLICSASFAVVWRAPSLISPMHGLLSAPLLASCSVFSARS